MLSQGLRMALCVCGIAPPTGWRTTSTMAWSASGPWPISRAPTSKYHRPSLCSVLRLCVREGRQLRTHPCVLRLCSASQKNRTQPPARLCNSASQARIMLSEDHTSHVILPKACVLSAASLFDDPGKNQVHSRFVQLANRRTQLKLPCCQSHAGVLT